jgi:bla regulator protein blaR1
MTGMQVLFHSATIHALGLTLVHSFWQFTIVGLIAACLAQSFRRTSAATRYVVYGASQFLILLLSGFTFLATWQSSSVSALLITPDRLGISVSFTDHGLSLSALNHVLPYIVIAWMTGTLFSTARFIGSLVMMKRLISRFSEPVTGGWQKKLDSLRIALGFSGKVFLLSSSKIDTPLTLGLLKPVIVFPVSLISSMPAEQVEAVLFHELAHIIRRDYLMNLIQHIVEILFFYHPAIWWLSYKTREERENCCDDMAIQFSGDSASYAKALLHLGSQKVRQPALAMPATGRNQQLLNRILRIVEGQKMNGYGMERLVTVCLLIIGIALIAGLTSNGIVVAEEENPVVICRQFTAEEGVDLENETILNCGVDLADKKIKLHITMKDGKISEILKDGQPVPEEDYPLYEKEITEMELLVKNQDCCKLPDMETGCRRMEIIKVEGDPAEESADSEPIRKIICIKKAADLPEEEN